MIKPASITVEFCGVIRERIILIVVAIAITILIGIVADAVRIKIPELRGVIWKLVFIIRDTIAIIVIVMVVSNTITIRVLPFLGVRWKCIFIIFESVIIDVVICIVANAIHVQIVPLVRIIWEEILTVRYTIAIAILMGMMMPFINRTKVICNVTMQFVHFFIFCCVFLASLRKPRLEFCADAFSRASFHTMQAQEFHAFLMLHQVWSRPAHFRANDIDLVHEWFFHLGWKGRIIFQRLLKNINFNQWIMVLLTFNNTCIDVCQRVSACSKAARQLSHENQNRGAARHHAPRFVIPEISFAFVV